MKFIKTIFKVLVTCFGLYFAFSSSDLTDVELTFQLEQYLFFFVILVLNAFNVILLGLRLTVLVPSLPIITGIKVNMIGLFFNLFLPTVIGGDIIRMYELNKYTKSSKSSIGLIMLDRIIGLTALALLAVLFVSLTYWLGLDNLEVILIYLTIGIFILILCAWVFLLAVRVTNGRFLNIFLKYLPDKISDQVVLLSETINEIDKYQIGKVFLISFLLQFTIGFQFYLVIAHMYGMDITLIVSSVISSITNLILVLPISIGGLGVRDYLYVLFVPEVVSNPELVLVGPTIYLMTLITGAFGGLIYLLDGRKKNYRDSDKNFK